MLSNSSVSSFASGLLPFRRVSSAARGGTIRRIILFFAVVFALCASTTAAYGQFSPASLNSGTVNIGTTGTTQIVTYTFGSAVTLGSVSVLTQGVSGRDFKNVSTGTCQTNASYSAGNTCTVAVSFTPAVAGTRYGAVVLMDGSGSTIATAYLQGTGSGPQAIFTPGNPTFVLNGAGVPYDMAVDPAGNIYIADLSNGRILKEAPNGNGYSESVVPTTAVKSPVGIAVDGAGNLYIGDNVVNEVIKETRTATGYVESILPTSSMNGTGCVKVDGIGSVYIEDYSNNRVLKETLSGNSYTESTIPVSALHNPECIAVDGNDSVYIADDAGKIWKETPSSNGYTESTVTNTAISYPTGVAVDGMGNVYVAASGNGIVFKETLTPTGYSESTIWAAPPGFPAFVTVDGNGNLYVDNEFNAEIVKLDLADPSTVIFGSAAVGYRSIDSPKTASVQNYGTSSLSLSNLSYPPDFPEGTGVSSDCTSTTALTATASCTLTINFQPGTYSPQYSEPITLTTNSLGVAGTPQNLTALGYAPPVYPVTDAFAGSGALSSKWTSIYPPGNFVSALQNNGQLGMTVQAQEALGVYTGALFTDDQYAQATYVAPGAGASSSTGLCVRMDRYGNGACYIGSTGAIVQLANGVKSSTISSACPVPSSGDTIQLSVVGTLYTCRDVTTGAASSTSASAPTEGYPAFLLDRTSSNAFSLRAFQADCLPSCSPASAQSTLMIGSYATGASNPGFANSAMAYVPNSSAVNTGSITTYGGDDDGGGHPSLGRSSSVAHAPNGAPNSPAGDYFYTTMFTVPQGVQASTAKGSITLLADDTVSVSLNGTQIVGSTGSGDGCAGYVPNCVTPTTFQFSGAVNGQNVLTFDVKEVDGYNENVDFLGDVAFQVPSVSVTPGAVSLNGGQTQQFAAAVNNSTNPGVTWSISPAGAGTISPSGLYTAPTTITAQQTVTVTATSQADTSQSGSATITLELPSCTPSGYTYAHAIVIDHTKVPNSDQTNFPFLFSTTDPSLATTAHGGHVANPNGYDIAFSTDAAGAHLLNYEIEEYNPTTGQVIAWINLPTLFHAADTVLYVLYGNTAITSSQQNAAGVWNSSYAGVWHFPNGTALSASDSTANGNNGTIESGTSAAVGVIDGGASFNGTSAAYISLPSASSAWNFSGDVTLSAWVKTSSTGMDVIQLQNSNPLAYLEVGPTTVGGSANKVVAYFRTNTGGVVVASGTITVSDGHWHSIQAVRNTGDSIQIYVDGVLDTTTPYTDSGSIDATGSAGVNIGGLDSGYNFNGVLDEVRVSNVARSADWIAAEYGNQSSPSTFYSFGSESAIEVTPPSVNLYGGQNQQFTATVMASGTCSSDVVWSMPAGSPGTLSSTGLYTAPPQVTAPQMVPVTATSATNSAESVTATVTLLPPVSNPTVSLSATAQPPYVTGTTQSFQATLKNGDGAPLSGFKVSFTVTGANTATGNAITDSNGTAQFTYTGANSGNDNVRASANVGNGTVTSNQVQAFWVMPVQSISTTTVVGRFFPLYGSCCTFNASPADTPLFTQVFPVINFNPPSGAIPGNTSSVGVGTHPFTDVTTDQSGNFTGTVIAQGNGYQAGNGSIAGFQAAFTGSFVVASSGNATISVYVDNAFILGIGGGATQVSGPMGGAPQTTPFEQYPVMGALSTSIGGATMTVHFPGPGTYPFELDYAEDGIADLSLTMMAGSPGSNGLAPDVPSSGALTLSPNSISALPQGGQQTFTVLATDASGAPVPNLSIGIVVTGVDNEELHAITDSTGHATFVYHDINPGTASVQAVAFISGMVAYSDIVSVPWTLPPSTSTASNGGGNTISISISAQSTVILPKTLSLSGSVTDSNPPTGSTLTITWSQVSGPGTVTFANPHQAVTTATFGQAGIYVLQLSATDSVNSGSVQFSVTVNPEPGTSQGWIGAPADGSAVTGIVPITVASGTTLASGTLTYYPANDLNAVVTLNANTTGSGQIGTFDATTLPNGSYWIQLQATDSSGNQEYSLVLVTVAGNYKPGRVTSTVTDLVVPANGLAIKIQRTYDTLNASRSEDFGYGWSLNTTVDLSVGPRGDVTFTLNGQRRTFYLTPKFGGAFLPFYFAAFTPEPGAHGTLTDSGSGCADLFDFLVPDGSLWECVGGGFYTPPGYIYTDASGTSYAISASGNLQSIVDKNGNALTIGANGITSTTGLSVPFVRDSAGRITKITDPAGNVYSYSYDAAGNLASVTYPGVTQPSTYTYDANHLYLSGTDFRNNPLPTVVYYGSSDTDANGLPLNGRLKSVTDALSETTSYAYNLATNTTTVTYPSDANGNVGTATMVYDSFGDLTSSTDPLGHKTTNVYDSNRNLLSTTDPLNHTTSYTYDSNGNRTSVTYPQTATSTTTTSTTVYNQFSEPTSTTDELGNVRTFNYDLNYNPQSVTDALGTLASFLFNPNGTMAAGTIGYDITSAPSMASQFVYDADGNLTSRTDALGRATSYTYNSLGQKTTMTIPVPSGSSASAATTTYTYDALGNLTQTAAPLGRTTGSTYDENGNKLTDTDARGNITHYQYDALNRLILTTYPDTTTSSKTYDFRNDVVRETDQAGNVTLNGYDLAGRLISVTRGYGTSNAAATSYVYYDDGRKKSETDALGHTTTYTYDAAGNLTAVAGVNGSFQNGYDDARNRVSMTDGNGNTTQYQYDARKRLTKTTYADSTFTTNAYDGPGNLISVTDQANHTVQYTYDAANQLHSVIQASSPNTSNNTTVAGYDADSNPISLQDANAHTTSSSFDLLGNLTGKTLPDGALTETRGYDHAGNLISLTHFNGKMTTYTYDNLNRLLSRVPDSTTGEPTVSFTYTSTGQRHTMTDASGTTTYGYDSLDRLTSKATPEGTLSYTYDAAGHLASMSSSNPGGVSVNYTYDSLNRLSTVMDNRLAGSNTTTYTYDTANNVATVTYPNGVQTQFQYDKLNRVSALATQATGYSYTRDATGKLTNDLELSSRSVTWNYDGIDRLTSEGIVSDPNGKNGTAAYGLDPVGNRTSASSSISGLNPVSGTFNADDELISETYDSNGNVLTSVGKAFSYDSENHLMSMNGGAVSLLYDGDGNRVAKTTSGGTTRYLVDDLNPTGYPQVAEELASGVVTRTYTYGLQRISEYQIVSSTWTPSFYGYDGMGSVRTLTNSVGAITDTYDYDAFGNKLNATGTTPNNYLYRGEQYDSDLGLYYLRARYYNPATGRFLSHDPETGDPTDPASLRKYAYAHSDPVDLSDPAGETAGAAVLPGRIGVGGAVGEYVVLSLQATAAAVSVATVGCAVDRAYFTLAAKFNGDEKITQEINCAVKGESRMHLQLQIGSPDTGGVTIEEATRTMVAPDPPGVTSAEVYAELDALGALAGGGLGKFPRSAGRGIWNAINQVKKCVDRIVPYGTPPGGTKNICQGYVSSNRNFWRIDLDQDAGVNLRQ